MSQEDIDIQEHDLHAYVDQQLSAKKVKAVEALILKNPKIAAKIQQWQQQNDLISQHFSKTKSNEIPTLLDINTLTTKQHHNTTVPTILWRYGLAASLFLMMSSGIIGWYLHDILQPKQQYQMSFVNSAISAYNVFSVEVLHPVEVSAHKKDHLITWLSERINHPLKVPELKQYGYKLLGGRLLAMKKGRPAAQLMFENNTGQRITLLVSKNPAYNDHAFLFKNEDKTNAFYWMDATIAYSVSGKIQRDKLQSVSEGIYQQITATQQLAGR